jgi:hypothetical protein
MRRAVCVLLSLSSLWSCAPDELTPRIASVTHGQSTQFSAPVQPSADAIWSVDGIKGGTSEAGTVTAAGLYTAPANEGLHTVRLSAPGDLQGGLSALVAVTRHAGVLTAHNDAQRTGQNTHELALSPTTVDAAHFGKLFALPLDGAMYAQPLVVPNLTIAGATRDVLFAATSHDSVYAFATDAAQTPIWQVSFLKPGVTPVPAADVSDSTDIFPEIGITGTPVIDPVTHTLYVVAKTKEPGPTYVQRLHALVLETGAEQPGSPVVITAAVPGTAPDAVNGLVQFSALRQLQRPALLLANHLVWIAFGSHGDVQPYHGWLLGYDAATLAQKVVVNTTPDGTEGSIWQSGGGVASDATGALYLETANGDFDADTGGRDLSSTVVRLNAKGQLVDWFTPFNQALLSANDVDLGSAGPLVLPDQPGDHPHLLIASGKSGYLYLIDRDAMGHLGANGDSQVVQALPLSPNERDPNVGVFSTPAYWNGRVYVASTRDTLKAFTLSDGMLSAKPSSQSKSSFRSYGGTVSISANGTQNGIAWLVEWGGDDDPVNAVLHAYDATDVSRELYSSAQAPKQRDAAAVGATFAVPTVANGRVYVGTSTELDVYGLLP